MRFLYDVACNADQAARCDQIADLIFDQDDVTAVNGQVLPGMALPYEMLASSYKFLSDDQERLERTRIAALAEVDALRQLVADIAVDIFPNPDVRASFHTFYSADPGNWRIRMVRAMAQIDIRDKETTP